MAQGLNEAGRGFNLAVVDPKTKSVVRVGHFDTYAEGKIFKIRCSFNFFRGDFQPTFFCTHILTCFTS